MTSKTEWFREAGWGIFCHYLAAPASSDRGNEISAEAWNARVDSFDTEALAHQLEEVGAPYFFITIGQCSGHYCSPNETYDSIVGIKPSKCSRRDLIADLHDALNPKGIKLLAYLPCCAPVVDTVAAERLEYERAPKGGERKDKRLKAFQTKWEAIIREWSLRWGDRVRGWWIDGCSSWREMYDHPEPPNLASLAAALRAGNPNSIIAFSHGQRNRVTEHEDYTAGENQNHLPVGIWKKMELGDRTSNISPLPSEVDGMQAHILLPLGAYWGMGDPRFPDELAVGYTKHLTKCGVVISWDVPIQDNGLIPNTFVQQLKLL